MRLKRLGVILILLGGLMLAYPAWIGFQVWEQSRHEELHSADAIVVLGAAQYDGRPSPVLQARLDHAAYLYKQDFSHTIVVTGGKRRGDRFTEAEAGERYLEEEQDIPPADIVEQSDGNNTQESLESVSDMAQGSDIDSVLLVSDPMHSERVKRIASDLGFEDVYVSWASYERLNRSRATKARELLREVAAIISYEWTGR